MLVVKKQYFWYRDSLVSFYYTISCHCRVVGRYYWGQWLLSLVGLVSGNKCAPNEVYVNITKRSLLFAKEESFQLFGGDMLLYSSPLFEDNQEQVLEVCLPFSVSSLYCVKLLDAGNDGWSNGGWIVIRDMTGGIVIETIMTEKSVEIVQFSLSSSIINMNPLQSRRDECLNYKIVRTY